MKANTHKHSIIVRSRTQPTVEVDPECAAVYVRFKHTKIVRTESRANEAVTIAIDFDAEDEVIGIEAIGIKDFNVNTVLGRASVQAPHADLKHTRYVFTRELVPA